MKRYIGVLAMLAVIGGCGRGVQAKRAPTSNSLVEVKIWRPRGETTVSIDRKDREDIGSTCRGMTSIDGEDVVRGIQLLSQAGAAVVTIGIKELRERGDLEEVDVILATGISVRLSAPGWAVDSLTLDGRDISSGDEVPPGRWRVRLVGRWSEN